MTTTLVHPSIDKSTWGDGPWQTEPDRLDFAHAGLPCLALRNHYGNWCGYVAVPPGHALHGTDYNDADVDVHGGLTYADRCQHDLGICHVPQPGESDDVWWFGFDCGHAWDVMPGMDALARQYGRRPIHEQFPNDGLTSYKTLDYVRAEIERLADQLAALR